MSISLSPSIVDTVQDLVLKNVNKFKIIRQLILTNLLERIIRSTYNVELMSYINGIDLCSDIQIKFEVLYQNTGFREYDIIFIKLSTQTAFNFSSITQFTDSLKYNYIYLKEIVINNISKWQFTTWILHGLNSKYNSFCIMLNNSYKAD